MQIVLRAIAEPHRREILRLISPAELSGSDVAGHFQLTRPAVSQHLRVLVRAGLITRREQGTRRFYRIRPDSLTELRRFLDELDTAARPHAGD